MKEEPSPAWWRVSVAEAIQLQRQWAHQVCRELRIPEHLHYVAGVDAAYRDGTVWGVAVLMQLPSLQLVESAVVAYPEEFPYIPGLLSFREAPAIIAALRALHHHPDIVLCDGQGIAHPRRLGIASHVGILTDLPTIGCAKSLLCGTADRLPEDAGATAPVWDRGELIAMAVRTRARVKPVYVSIGHRVDLPFAVRFVLQCCRRYRLPEPIRLADALSKQAVRGTAGVVPLFSQTGASP